MLVQSYRPLWFLLVQDVTYTRVDVVRLLIFNFQLSIVNFAKRLSGGYCGGVPPLPIPNREVKPVIADGTAMQCGRVGSRLLSDGEVSQTGSLSFFYVYDCLESC